MRQARDDLHEGREVVQLHTLRGNLDQELNQFRTVTRVTLAGHTPHEEERHLWEGGRGGGEEGGRGIGGGERERDESWTPQIRDNGLLTLLKWSQMAERCGAARALPSLPFALKYRKSSLVERGRES